MPLDLDLFQDKAEASIWTVKRISALQIMILGHMISMNRESHPYYRYNCMTILNLLPCQL